MDSENLFSQRLRELCKETGKSVRHVVKQIGISSSIMYTYLRGERLPNTYNLILIVDYFGVSADYLLGRTDKKEINK